MRAVEIDRTSWHFKVYRWVQDPMVILDRWDEPSAKHLDRLDDWARETIAYEELGAAKDGLVITEAWDEWFRATQVLALVERVRTLEAALERIASGNPVLYGAARIAAAALAAAGGPDGQ